MRQTHCSTCGEPLTFPGTTECLDCRIKADRRRERSWVPDWGPEIKRLSGRTGECQKHRRRGCIECFGEVRGG